MFFIFSVFIRWNTLGTPESIAEIITVIKTTLKCNIGYWFVSVKKKFAGVLYADIYYIFFKTKAGNALEFLWKIRTAEIEFFRHIFKYKPFAVMVVNVSCNLLHNSVINVNLFYYIFFIILTPGYKKHKLGELIGRSLLECHNKESQEKIRQVTEWFAQDESHNIVYTFYNEKQNKDVYMVALRDSGKLIGYYEKHEYRDRETMKMYDLWWVPPNEEVV